MVLAIIGNMAISANRYANKVYSEHPIAMWPMDEEAYYISLIDDSDRLFSTWTKTGCTSSDSPTIPADPPPIDSTIYSSLTKSTTTAGTMQAVSAGAFGIADLNPNVSTITLNTFLYQNPTYINWFKIGIQYTNGGTQTVLSSAIPAPSAAGWINLNHTLDVPTTFTGNISVIIQVDFLNSAAGDATSRTVIMNGLSVGQGSQTTCYTSLGSTAVDLPADLGLPTAKGVNADQYGMLADNGYYIVKTNALLGQNDAMSMIYGTDNSTRITPSGTSLPSFIFPGKGMLHNNGRGNEYSFEMWLKIDPQTSTSKRIVGPLDSSDGIYVKEGFITLAIGDRVGSHYVGQWYRPMLVHIVLKESNALLMINGEEVVNIDYPRYSVDLSSGRDWWGIYSYNTVKYFSIDCIAIYPYVVSNTLAKRRFIYGQGTPNIQTLDTAYEGTPTNIDFATAEYGPSVIYPDAHRWDAGYFNNMTATRDYLSVPNYSLPFINLRGRDVEEWYADNLTVNTSENGGTTGPYFISFRPNQVTRTNLITNPSFETNTTGWIANGAATIARVTSDFKFGAASLEVTQAAQAFSGLQSSPLVPVTANVPYNFSGYIKVPSGQPALRMGLLVHNIDSTGAIISQPNTGWASYTSAQGWVRLSLNFTPSPNTVNVRLHFITDSTLPTAGQKFLIDGISLEQIPDPLPYFDGSYADPTLKTVSYGWTGTAHASTSTLSYWNPDGINYQDPSYFNFPTLNVLNDQVAAVYGVFQADSNIASDRTLFSFSNTINGDTFDITLNADAVEYSINGRSLYQEYITIGTPFAAGLHIPTASTEYGYEVSNFFSSPSSIQLYVGGNGINTFEGKIYNVSLSNNDNYSVIYDNFYASGVVGEGFAKDINASVLLNHIASYTLIPEYEYGKMFLDISVSSSWEEFYPLSYFATYKKDESGGLVYDVDMLQINIWYATVESTGVWTYQDMKDEFAGQTYADVVTSVYSTYFDLKNKNTAGGAVSTAGSSMQGYLTFQTIASGANSPLSSFPYQKPLDSTGIIYVDNENTNLIPDKAYQTKFSFVNDSLVFPPKSQPFEDYAMVIHLDINQRSILRNPLKIRKMEITSKGYNENSSIADQRTHIGTRTGQYIYPYVQELGTLNNAGKKPFSISKETVPYLYNALLTGIRVRNEAIQGDLPLSDTQIFIPVNEAGASDFTVAAIQFMIKPDFTQTADTVKLLKIDSNDGNVIFSLNKDGSTTATVSPYTETGNGFLLDGGPPATGTYVEVLNGGESDNQYFVFVDFGTDVSQTGAISEVTYVQSSSNFEYYQNGRYVPALSLTNDEWYTVGIQFPGGMDFSDSSDGGITLFGGARFNNVSYYLSGGMGTESELSSRVWQDVLDANGVGATLWSYWNGSTWQDVYILGQTSSYSITPAELYDAYVGTNGNIVDDGYGLMVQQKGMKLLTGASWSLISGKPV